MSTDSLPSSLAAAPLRVLDGFGRAVVASCRTVEPRNEDELAQVLSAAHAQGVRVAFRGSGRSYGDAALGSTGLVVDLRKLNRLLSWNAEDGVAEAQGGLTIEGLWRRTIEDGYWPHVVPGTMAPTLAGCVSMNIHGKNHFKVGPFGDYLSELELMTVKGERLRCSLTENADLFRAVVGGAGLLGAITKVKLRLKRIHSGLLRVTPYATRSLEEMFSVFERELPNADYLVGWVDCMSGGKSLGRGQIHRANYLEPGEDPDAAETLHVERQGLPSTILGVPKSILWRLMRPWANNPGWRFVNAVKYAMSAYGPSRPYLQSHVGFAFLLDYVPNWRLAYGNGGLIQVQVFVPEARARATFSEILSRSQRRGLPPYLGVFKRHRSDSFLLSHGVDGYSMAMDFRITRANRDEVWRLAHEVHDLTLDAGGRLYFAKDAVLSVAEAERSFGAARLAEFGAIKRRLDPDGVLETDLSRRALQLTAEADVVRRDHAPTVPSAALPALAPPTL